MEVNKKRWLCGGTAAALALALAVAGIVCWFRTNRVPPPKTSIRIGVALYRGDDTFISTVRAALEERAKAYEQETGIKVVMDIVDAKLNQNTQNSQVERFISLGYDALCVNIVDRSAASIIIDKAMDAGIPVVFFNREPVEEDMNRWEKLYYVGADAKESAVLQGAVLVDGVDVRDYSLKNLRNGVGMVLQKNVLFSGTIEENLRWGDEDASREELVKAAVNAQADGFVTAFKNGYHTEIGQGGAGVSGGQKQRLCIARALLKKPKILILDDSTSAVDTATEAAIRESFKNELKDTTRIIIAQRISSVQDADRILVLDDGKIIGSGTHEELLRTCRAYEEIYVTQTGENRAEEAEA